jgi:hypothetical protein
MREEEGYSFNIRNITKRIAREDGQGFLKKGALRFDRNAEDLGRWVSEVGYWEKFNHVRMDVTLDIIERARKKRPALDDLITSWVSDAMADLSVMAECWRQIMLYQPWSTRFLHEVWPDTTNDKPEGDSEKAKEQKKRKYNIFDTITSRIPKLPTTLVLKAIPAGKRFYYPSNKRPTRSNTETMRQAEVHLDDFWKDLLVLLQEKGLLSERDSVLHRSITRTPPWVEITLPQRAHIITEEVDLQIYFSTLTLDHIKTRGVSNDGEDSEQEKRTSSCELQTATYECRPRLKIDQRTSKALGALFHIPDSKGHQTELNWTEMLHAMTRTGFAAEKLYGSIWQFTPTDNLEFTGTTRSIQFHEPHPQNSLPYWKARRLGRRLTRRYGWSWETFEVV